MATNAISNLTPFDKGKELDFIKDCKKAKVLAVRSIFLAGIIGGFHEPW